VRKYIKFLFRVKNREKKTGLGTSSIWKLYPKYNSKNIPDPPVLLECNSSEGQLGVTVDWLELLQPSTSVLTERCHLTPRVPRVRCFALPREAWSEEIEDLAPPSGSDYHKYPSDTEIFSLPNTVGLDQAILPANLHYDRDFLPFLSKGVINHRPKRNQSPRETRETSA